MIYVRAYIYCLYAAALITLHQPGGVVYVNPEEIMVVLPASPPNTPKGIRSQVLVHDKWVYVLETPEQVKAARDGGE